MLSVVTFVLMFVEIVCALLLICAIMVQKSTSTGGGLAIGTSVGEAYWGAKAGNVLTRLTVILGIVFLVNTTMLGFVGKLRGTTGRSHGEALSGRRGAAAVMPADTERPEMRPLPSADEEFPLLPETGLDVVPPAAETVVGEFDGEAPPVEGDADGFQLP